METQYQLPIEIRTQQAPGVVERLGPALISAGSRPRADNPVVKQAAAEMILPEIIGWLGADAKAHNPEDLLNQLIAVASSSKNGYELTKSLECKCWSVDSELVEIMDQFSDYIRAAHDRLIAVWVREFDIKPQHAVGDRVTIKTWIRNDKGRDQLTDVEGVITHIYAKVATYTVCCESLGHVRKGYGTHGFVVRYEDVRSATSLAA